MSGLNKNKGQVCSVEMCAKDAFCKTFCSKHYSRWVITKDPLKTLTGKKRGVRRRCTLPNCEGLLDGHGYCNKHSRRFKKYGDPLKTRRQNLGRRKYSKDGYVILNRPDYQYSRKDGSIFEHRYVMEQHIGRQLLKNEIVHHKNGIRSDNRLENLERLLISEHYKGHKPIKCTNCGMEITSV